MIYSSNTIQEVLQLRNKGKTYREIRFLLKRNFPKSTLSKWCKNATLPKNYADKIVLLNIGNLNKARLVSRKMNKIRRAKSLKEMENYNLPIAKKIQDREIAKIALAMFCLGEASKTRGSFSLGSSDPRIIILFIKLLEKCFVFDVEKIRCTVQCRADQDIEMLETYWLNITKIPKRLFYKAQIDPRTRGKPTKMNDYKGVLRVDYFNTKIQIELETLAQLLYNQIA